MRGRLYLTSSALVFLGSRDTKKLLRLENLAALDKARTSGVRSAAITCRSSSEAELPLQVSAFRSRNRTFSALQQHLITRLPHLAAAWRTPSSGKLQVHPPRDPPQPPASHPLHTWTAH